MIERKIVSQKVKEFEIEEYMRDNLKKCAYSHTKLQRTPLGEKVIIFSSRPGLIVGKQGANIKKLTLDLKKKFNLENPQIEISEIENPDLDPSIIAERISNSLEMYGISRFKGIGHKTMTDVMNSGALGVEILISGKIPSDRAKKWRFYQGYLKKSGDIAVDGVLVAYTTAELKTGTIGIQVRIMPSNVTLPDNVTFLKEVKEEVLEVKEANDVEKKEEEIEETEALREIKEKVKQQEEKKKETKEKKPRVKKEKKETKEENKD
jgi:small subunit ribosomal protein S3